MFADPRAASGVSSVARIMVQLPARAMHEREPTADRRAIARIIGDGWPSNLVGWVTRRASASDVASHLEFVARLPLPLWMRRRSVTLGG
jgi:TetR/AcrR family transcriptional regulator, cholesterol catabolism regulator